MNQPKLVVTLQCSIVKERCAGYYCVKDFEKRGAFFSDYPADADIRFMSMECGGCCGKRVTRKFSNLKKQLKKSEIKFPEDVVAHLSSCISKENFHSPPCPHVEYIRTLLGRHKLAIKDGSTVSETARKRREEGVYQE